MARTEGATKPETFSNAVISKMAYDFMDEIGAAIFQSENYQDAVRFQYPNHQIDPNNPFPPSNTGLVWREGKNRYEVCHRANYPTDRAQTRYRDLRLVRMPDEGPRSTLSLKSSFEELTREKKFIKGPNCGFIVVEAKKGGHSFNDQATLNRMRKEFPLAFPKS